MSEQALPLAQKATQLFTERGIENARLEAELLLAHVLGLKRLDLYLQHDRPVDTAQLEQFRVLVRRRLKHEPLQYIVGHVQFREIELAVDRRALIPRPETELLVGEVVKFTRTRPDQLRVIDIGTGTGAIALSLVHECPNVVVVATDISGEALELARRNGLENENEIEYVIGSVWSTVPSGMKFDVVVSNPPYIAEHERAELAPEVRDWEPGQALFAGADGLAVIREIISGAPQQMNPNGLLALEIGMTQAAEVKELLSATSSFENILVVPDLTGRDRIITAVRK